MDLVNAATIVDQARTQDEKAQAQQSLAEMLEQRQSTFVRWTLDRHVNKIRVLPRDTAVLKPISEFEKKDAAGRTVTDWRAYGSHLLVFLAHRYGGQYIGYGSDPPAPSKETIMPNIERLIVATSPIQEFIMTTRRVYRWEYPAETLKYMGIYIVLWYFDLLLPGVLSALLYLVVERRWHGQSIEDLRNDIKHIEDVERTALSLTEFIEKRGDENWANELLQDLGKNPNVRTAHETYTDFIHQHPRSLAHGSIGRLGKLLRKHPQLLRMAQAHTLTSRPRHPRISYPHHRLHPSLATRQDDHILSRLHFLLSLPHLGQLPRIPSPCLALEAHLLEHTHARRVGDSIRTSRGSSCTHRTAECKR